MSFYRWGVAFRQRDSNLQPDKADKFRGGHNFTQWVELNPNLQSTIMVRGMAAMEAEYYGKLAPMRSRLSRKPSRAEFIALRRKRGQAGRGVARSDRIAFALNRNMSRADLIESHWRDVQAQTWHRNRIAITSQSHRNHAVIAHESQALLDQFAVVGTMKRFDESLLVAADLSGLPFLLYKRNQPHQKGGFRGNSDTVRADHGLGGRDVTRGKRDTHA